MRVERRGDAWRTRVWSNGREASKTFARKVDAERWGREIETDRDRGQWIDVSAGRMTFGTWVEKGGASTVNLRASTAARDESYLKNQILPTFGDTPINRIDHLMVRNWVERLGESGRAPATIVKAHQILGKTMRAAMSADLIRRNPCEGVPLPRVERKEMRFLTPEQLAQLADKIDRRYRAFVFLCGYGGLRAGEVFGLTRPRIDLEHGLVDVAESLVEVRGRHYVGPPKTRAGRRVVPIPGFVVNELREHIGGSEGFVFTAAQGGPIRLSLFRRRIWTPAVEAAELAPLRIHDLRHTAISFWIAVGASPKEIAMRAGHTSTAVVLDRYGHLLPNTEQRTTDALNALATAAARPTLRIA